MSWKERLDNSKFSITTGDGKVFKPLLNKGNTKSREFNSTAFEFIDVDGTYIDKRKPKSSKYDLIVYFQGSDCFDQADSFEKSAEDPRYWTVEHPVYGTLRGQPTNISRDDSSINVTVLSIEFWESIINGFIEKKTTIKDEIFDKKTELDDECANSFALKATIVPSKQNEAKQFTGLVDSKYSKYLNDKNYNTVKSATALAINASDDMIEDPKTFIKSLCNLVVKIVDFEQPTMKLIQALNQIYDISWNLFDTDKGNDFDKYFFESVGSAIISTMSAVSLFPKKDDYVSRSDVQNISSIIDSTYTDYFNRLNVFESQKNNKNINYTPSFKIQSKLNSIVKKTMYDLFSLSFDFKQERTVELLSDSNLILLTHKYMGLDSEDENIDTFRKINNIKNSKLFSVKKGSKIKYFV